MDVDEFEPTINVNIILTATVSLIETIKLHENITDNFVTNIQGISCQEINENSLPEKNGCVQLKVRN